MSAQGPGPAPEHIQALHDRYLLEVVEALALCPFARRCREQGRVARPLFYTSPGHHPPEGPGIDPALVAAELDRLTRADPQLEVVLLTFVLPPDPGHPWHSVDACENLVRAVRDAYEARIPAGLRFYMVGFHPRLQGPADSRRPPTPDGLVPWLRRTPDPVIQCIRADLLDQVRRQAQAAANARFLEEMGRLGPEYRALAATAIQSDPELSADIARHNFASVGTGPGRVDLEQRIAALLAARVDL